MGEPAVPEPGGRGPRGVETADIGSGRDTDSTADQGDPATQSAGGSGLLGVLSQESGTGLPSSRTVIPAILALLGTVLGVVSAPSVLRPLVGTLGVGFATLILVVPVTVPPLRRRFRRTRAIGSAPALLAFAILSLRLTPNLESAADFAAEAVDGTLGRSLVGHRRATVDGSAAFEAFAAEWSDLDPSLPGAVSLMQVAIAAPDGERSAVLERALETVLEGSRERVASFSTGIRGPAMGIYAFGVMLPLALVGMLPVLATTGGGVPMWLLAGFYDLVLPVALVVASLWLASRRPAIAGQTFDRNLLRHAPDPSIIGSLGVVTAAGAFVVTPILFPRWARWIVAFGAGGGIALVVGLSPVRQVQAEIDELETGFPDALAITGRQIREGTPVESAIDTVGNRLTGPTGRRFDAASRIRDRMGVTVETAFLGEHGVLPPEERVRVETPITLLTVAGDHGAPGGETVVAMGDYLERLHQVKREARRDLARTTSTLRQTAVVFAPLIAGVTVALATGMDSVEAPGKAIDVSTMGLVIGAYVLLLAIVLPALAVVLERGLDPVRIGYRSGIALASGSVLYPLAFLAARTLVYV